jgi:hypothetical protein
MSSRKGLVLDANVLLRAVFGVRVMQLLETYKDVADFYSPDVCFAEAEKYIPHLAKRRALDSALARSILKDVRTSLSIISFAPQQGSVGTVVTIRGQGFSAAPRGQLGSVQRHGG